MPYKNPDVFLLRVHLVASDGPTGHRDAARLFLDRYADLFGRVLDARPPAGRPDVARVAVRALAALSADDPDVFTSLSSNGPLLDLFTDAVTDAALASVPARPARPLPLSWTPWTGVTV